MSLSDDFHVAKAQDVTDMRSTLFSPVSLPVQNGIVVMQSNAHYAHLGPEKHFSSRFSSKRDSRFCRHWDWILRLTSVMCRARKRPTLQAKFGLEFCSDAFLLHAIPE